MYGCKDDWIGIVCLNFQAMQVIVRLRRRDYCYFASHPFVFQRQYQEAEIAGVRVKHRVSSEVGYCQLEVSIVSRIKFPHFT